MCVSSTSVSCISLPVVAIIFLYVEFFVRLLSCHNFIGHNLMFGTSFVQDYSSIPLDLFNLVRDLRDNSLYVPGFLTSELNLFVHNVTTS